LSTCTVCAAGDVPIAVESASTLVESCSEGAAEASITMSVTVMAGGRVVSPAADVWIVAV
jgi:hypothetical protein